MRVVGLRSENGRVVWADAGDWPIAPLDLVTVRLHDEEIQGRAFVTPERLIRPFESVVGTVVAVEPSAVSEPECSDLPGGGMPPLGSEVRIGPVLGIVTRIDPVHRTITATRQNGECVDITVEELVIPDPGAYRH